MIAKHRNLVDGGRFSSVGSTRKHGDACRPRRAASCPCVDPIRSEFESFVKIHVPFLNASSRRLPIRSIRSLTEIIRFDEIHHRVIFFQIVLHRCSRQHDSTQCPNFIDHSSDGTLRIFTRNDRLRVEEKSIEGAPTSYVLHRRRSYRDRDFEGISLQKRSNG